jgi:CheY-like chemotaxis protein
MNGQIWVESEEGHGSTFHFVVPFCPPERRPTPTLPIDVLRGRQLLLVSRQPTARQIYTELLENLGVVPTAVSSAPEATRALHAAGPHRTPFELVLLDVSWSDHDDGPHRHIDELLDTLGPTECGVIALLPMDRTVPPRDHRSAPVVSFLAKPPTTAELVEAMIDALGHHHPVDDVPCPSPPATAERPLRILLADDGPVNQEVAVGLLHLQGHHVTVVANGSDAVDAVEQESYDVVLMDLEMPILDGLEATRRIRQRESHGRQRTPIIAMTAHAVAGHRERCLEAGMDGYISKPIEPDQLFAALDSCCAEGLAV